MAGAPKYSFNTTLILLVFTASKRNNLFNPMVVSEAIVFH